MSLIDQLKDQISGEALSGLSQQLGTDEQTTQSAISQALPMLMGVLAKQTGTRDGASGLMSMIDQEGDGIMDDLVGFLSKTDNGSGPSILNSLLGNKRQKVEEGVSQMTNLDAGKSSQAEKSARTKYECYCRTIGTRGQTSRFRWSYRHVEQPARPGRRRQHAG